MASLSDTPLARFYSRSNAIPASDLASRSNRQVEWVCSFGHTWRATPSNLSRAKAIYCRFCIASADPDELKSAYFDRYGIDREWLMANYVEAEASLDELWQKTGIGHTVIRACLKAHELTKSRDSIIEAKNSKRDSTNLERYGSANPHSFAARVGTSSLEKSVATALDLLGLEYDHHDQTTIAPKELDFLVPSRSLAIEVNGIYWHDKEKWLCDLRDGTSLSREETKRSLCSAVGIGLIHLWEDDWKSANNPVEELRRAIDLGIDFGTMSI